MSERGERENVGWFFKVGKSALKTWMGGTMSRPKVSLKERMFCSFASVKTCLPRRMTRDGSAEEASIMGGHDNVAMLFSYHG